MVGFFTPDLQDTGSVLAAQRRQTALVDAVRDTSGGLSKGITAFPQRDGSMGLVSVTGQIPPMHLPPARGPMKSLIDASDKSIDLSEKATTNRKALLQAIAEKLPPGQPTAGPPGSQAAAQLSSEYSTPRGAAGYSPTPLGVPPSRTSRPIHVGQYRMTPEGKFVTFKEKSLGLGSVESWAAPLGPKTIEAEDAGVGPQLPSLAAPATTTPETATLAAPPAEVTTPTQLPEEVPTTLIAPTPTQTEVSTLGPTPAPEPTPELITEPPEPVFEPIDNFDTGGEEGGGGDSSGGAGEGDAGDDAGADTGSDSDSDSGDGGDGGDSGGDV